MRHRPDPRERTINAMRRARDASRDGLTAHRQRDGVYLVPSRSRLLPHVVRVIRLSRHPVVLCDCRRPNALAAPAGMVSCWHAAAVLVDLAGRDQVEFDGIRWRLSVPVQIGQRIAS